MGMAALSKDVAKGGLELMADSDRVALK